MLNQILDTKMWSWLCPVINSLLELELCDYTYNFLVYIGVAESVDEGVSSAYAMHNTGPSGGWVCLSTASISECYIHP